MVAEIEIDSVDCIDQYTSKCKEQETVYLREFPVVDSTFSYADFFKDYLLKNRPCKIINVCANWEARRFWLENGKPHFCYLLQKYGTCKVMIYDCHEKYFNSQRTKEYEFSEYLKYWEQCIGNQYKEKLLYLKDWHLKNQFPDDSFYEVPVYFASDWLNEYLCENSMDDYRFVYMGPKGTWTPFHVDVFTSYSWSVNICGQKRWVFYPPGVENKLKDSLGNLPYSVTEYSHINEGVEVIQNAGEAIFVPAGWHHQVWNLDDTISINHNWINGCNIEATWYSLQNALDSVKKEIDDCKEMENFLDHCQVVLKASFGMDFLTFYDLVKYIAIKRIDFIEKNEEIRLPDNRKLGKNHANFDLRVICIILELLLQHDDTCQLKDFTKIALSPSKLLQMVKQTLQ